MCQTNIAENEKVKLCEGTECPGPKLCKPCRRAQCTTLSLNRVNDNSVIPENLQR